MPILKKHALGAGANVSRHGRNKSAISATKAFTSDSPPKGRLNGSHAFTVNWRVWPRFRPGAESDRNRLRPDHSRRADSSSRSRGLCVRRLMIVAFRVRFPQAVVAPG